MKPDKDSVQYSVKIIYTGRKAPKVYITYPKIPVNSKTHMYPDGSLCLYYPKDDPWRRGKHIHETIIPWTAEWLVYYEIYQVTGAWLGPEQSHSVRKEQEQTIEE
jgi:hypothetical protein